MTKLIVCLFVIASSRGSFVLFTHQPLRHNSGKDGGCKADHGAEQNIFRAFAVVAFADVAKAEYGFGCDQKTDSRKLVHKDEGKYQQPFEHTNVAACILQAIGLIAFGLPLLCELCDNNTHWPKHGKVGTDINPQVYIPEKEPTATITCIE